ncbi:MAG: hypothetical protein NTW50_04885, partial [Candidatus Berkelbacteria bacterium]|nr:hypothetical protein [Candidatus Berkelbacteria bacterium]
LTQLEWSCRWFSFDRMLICLESKLAKPNYKSEFYDLIYLCQLTDFIRDYDLNYISFIVGRFRYDELLPVAYICSTSTVMLPDIGYLTYHKDWFSQLDDRLIALAPDGSFVLITKDQCRPITYSYALEKFGGLAKFVSQLRQICNDKLELASYIIKRHRKRLAWRALYS